MSLDLNLLTALDALLEEGTVAGAADRLRLSAPAMSRTLGRIRRATGDPILVRTGRAMTPTPYALGVRADVHRLVGEARALLAPERELEPAGLDRTFTVRFHDAVADAAGPALLAAVRTAAPGVRLRFLAETATDTDDLRHGRVDLEAGSAEPASAGIRAETVVHDRLTVALPAGDPRKRLTVRQYAAAAHVIVSRRGRLRDPIDDALDERGLHRQVVASVPTTDAALRLVAAAGLLATVPARMAAAAANRHGLRLTPLPLPVPPSPIVLTWPQRYDGDRAHIWLRDQARAALHTVASR